MNEIKKDFPIFKNVSQPFIYLDSAATAHKPQPVIDAIKNFYEKEYAAVGRSMYSLAEEATQKVIDTRKKVANFINADPYEIIFTKGATEGLNFVAFGWGMHNLKPGDEIVLTELEHHANLLPWQKVAKETGAVLKFISMKKDGSLDLSKLDQIITSKTKIVPIIHISNALGTEVEVEKIFEAARKVGARTLLDACQSAPHKKLDVKKLKPDFLVFSGHKLYAPTGIGVLYINKDVQDEVPYYQLGGGTVFDAEFDKVTLLKAPQKFEAGTLPVAQIIGLGAAIDYINTRIPLDKIGDYEAALLKKLIEGLEKLSKVYILGPIGQLKKRGHLVSFIVEGIHPHDVAAFLDQEGIIVRAGHFCAQPTLKKLCVEGAVRASVGAYTTPEDIDKFLGAMKKLVR